MTHLETLQLFTHEMVLNSIIWAEELQYWTSTIIEASACVPLWIIVLYVDFHILQSLLLDINAVLYDNWFYYKNYIKLNHFKYPELIYDWKNESYRLWAFMKFTY